MDFILASGSPRRRELLTQMGLADFRICAPDIDERVDGAPAPQELVAQLSLQKARAVQEKVGAGPLILAADTIVCLDGAILGKPKSEAQALTMLQSLSGRWHEVFTGFTLLQGGEVHTEFVRTKVHLRALSAAELVAYVATGEPMDKAGSYGIQGRGALLVEEICGDYFNVMGLPVCRVSLALQEFGVFCLKGYAR